MFLGDNSNGSFYGREQNGVIIEPNNHWKSHTPQSHYPDAASVRSEALYYDDQFLKSIQQYGNRWTNSQWSIGNCDRALGELNSDPNCKDVIGIHEKSGTNLGDWF